jgi:hypothetical protein
MRKTNPLLEELGAQHVKRPLLKVIRAKCLDCCCGSSVEVRECPIHACDLWPYRMGNNPFFNGGKKIESPARVDQVARLVQAKKNHDGFEEKQAKLAI